MSAAASAPPHDAPGPARLLYHTPDTCLLLIMSHLSERGVMHLVATCKCVYMRIMACVHQHEGDMVPLLWLLLRQRIDALPGNQRSWYASDEAVARHTAPHATAKKDNIKKMVGMGEIHVADATVQQIAVRLRVIEKTHPLLSPVPPGYERLRETEGARNTMTSASVLASIHRDWHRLRLVARVASMSIGWGGGPGVALGDAPMAHGRHVLHWRAAEGVNVGVRRYRCTGLGQGSVTFPAGAAGEIVHGRRMPGVSRVWHADNRGPPWRPPAHPFAGVDPRGRNRTVIAQPFARPGQRVYAKLDMDAGILEIYVDGEYLGIISSGIYGVMRWDVRFCPSGRGPSPLASMDLICGQRAAEMLENDIARGDRV